MKDFFKDKFEYNRICNQKILALFADEPKFNTHIVEKLYNHSINAHQMWNKRILGTHNSLITWTISELEQLDFYDLENYKDSFRIIEDFPLKKEIKYRNSSGQDFINTIEDILFHIINHSTYHRGQIMTELKLAGAIPVATDFIFYKRLEQK
ncbi:MAG TPA: DinB family protein [Salinimicrobium sp.]|nr:DinB family protein [Salinimicrobium sp.]